MKTSHLLDTMHTCTTRLVLGSFALGACTAAIAAPITIDFDDLGSIVPVDSTYSGLGVTFVDALTTPDGSLPGGTSPNAIVHASSFYQPQPGDPIEAIFSSPVTFVSLTGLDVGYNGFVLSAYDAVSGGSLLDTDQVFGSDPIGTGEYYTLSLNAVGIRRVEFSQVQNILGDTIAYDNFVFDTVVIPIPAAVWLFGSGLLGLIGIARRKKAV